MDIDNLIRMANRIADFFKAMPNREQALHDAVEHIHRFWEPRMRKEMQTHLETNQGLGLDPFLIEAFAKYPIC